MKMKNPINIEELSKNAPVIYKAQIYFNNDHVVDVPGVHTHMDAFGAGFALAKQLNEEKGYTDCWVYVTETATPPPEEKGL